MGIRLEEKCCQFGDGKNPLFQPLKTEISSLQKGFGLDHPAAYMVKNMTSFLQQIIVSCDPIPGLKSSR